MTHFWIAVAIFPIWLSICVMLCTTAYLTVKTDMAIKSYKKLKELNKGESYEKQAKRKASETNISHN